MSSSGCLRLFIKVFSSGCLQAFITAVEALALNRSWAVYQLLPPDGLAANALLSCFFGGYYLLREAKPHELSRFLSETIEFWSWPNFDPMFPDATHNYCFFRCVSLIRHSHSICIRYTVEFSLFVISSLEPLAHYIYRLYSSCRDTTEDSRRRLSSRNQSRIVRD